MCIDVMHTKYKNIKTRSSAIARIADRTGCRWPSKSFKWFKVYDFHVIWKPLCDFLLVLNSNLSSVLHHSATIARTDFQSHQRSMIFYFIRKGVCHFPLAIGLICHCFWDMAIFQLTKRTLFHPPVYSTPYLKMFPLH